MTVAVKFSRREDGKRKGKISFQIAISSVSISTLWHLDISEK